jgi:hypothetical protein
VLLYAELLNICEKHALRKIPPLRVAQCEAPFLKIREKHAPQKILLLGKIQG